MLDFEIEADELQRVAEELGALPKELKSSYNRALTRTVATLRKLSSKGLQSELNLRRAAAIRRRLKSIRVKGNSNRMGEVKLWFGLNDLPVSEFKGRVAQDGERGAAHLGDLGKHDFPQGFVAKSRYSKRRMILQRTRASRLPVREAQLPVQERAQVFVEDEVFYKLEEIFWRHFRDDLERRVAYVRAR